VRARWRQDTTAWAVAKAQLASLETRLAASQKLFEDEIALFLRRELEPDFGKTLAAHRDLLERTEEARAEEARLRPLPSTKLPKPTPRPKPTWTF
jgi:hypothetical protein